MHFALPNLLTDVGLGKTNDLNVGDPSRMRDDDGLKAAEAISADAPSFAKRSKRGTIDMVEVDKVRAPLARPVDTRLVQPT